MHVLLVALVADIVIIAGVASVSRSIFELSLAEIALEVENLALSDFLFYLGRFVANLFH